MEGRINNMEKEVGEISAMLKEHISKENEVITTIEDTIKVVVNGKIDKLHNILEKQNESTGTFHDKVDAHIERVEPVISAYEASERALNDAKASGKFIIWTAGFITAIGAAYLMIAQIFFPPKI